MTHPFMTVALPGKCDPGCGIRDAGQKRHSTFSYFGVPPRHDNYMEVVAPYPSAVEAHGFGPLKINLHGFNADGAN
jgi:hypothetical protein